MYCICFQEDGDDGNDDDEAEEETLDGHESDNSTHDKTDANDEESTSTPGATPTTARKQGTKRTTMHDQETPKSTKMPLDRPKFTKKGRREDAGDAFFVTATSALEKLAKDDRRMPEDADEKFGRHAAEEMRAIHAPQLKVLAKRIIQNALCDAQAGIIPTHNPGMSQQPLVQQPPIQQPSHQYHFGGQWHNNSQVFIPTIGNHRPPETYMAALNTSPQMQNGSFGLSQQGNSSQDSQASNDGNTDATEPANVYATL